MAVGIDYGRGQTNIDHKTGIRFGVISQSSVCQALSDSDLDYDYGDPTCPKCGGTVKDCMATDADELIDSNDETEYEQYGHGCADFACGECKHTLDSQDCYGDEAQGWSYSADGYELSNCLDSDIIITKSPYYTHAPYCSPCVPGACSVEQACEDGAKAYCLGHDWFESNVAPYPVYSVETGLEVSAPIR